MKDKIIKLFHAYFNQEKLDNDFFTKDFLNLLKDQSLLPYLFYVSDNKNAQKYYFASAIHQETLNDLQSRLTGLFNQEQIKHLYVKGSVLNHLYDDNALRTRGDIDVLIDLKDLEKAKNILSNEGFTADESDVYMHHIEMRKQNTIVELHFTLFNTLEDAYHKFFKAPFKMSHLIDNYYYELNQEEHFVYCLCHLAKHLRIGAGIRYILDFYYMNKKWTLDYSKLHKMINKLNLMTLYQNILNTIYILTGEKQDIDIYEEKDVDFFIKYLLENGVHGLGENADFISKHYGEKKHKFKHILKTAFIIDKGYRLALYPKLGKHLIFYPLCLIHRFFYLIIHKSKKLFLFLFAKHRPNKEKDDFYKKLGIK